MIKCIAKSLLVYLLQIGLLYAALFGIEYNFPLSKPDMSWGITLHYFVFYIYPIMLIGVDLAFLLWKKKILLIALLFILTNLLYWYPSLNSYPHRTPVLFLLSLIITFLGGVFIRKTASRPKV